MLQMLPLVAAAFTAAFVPAAPMEPSPIALDTTVVDSLGPVDDRSALGGRYHVHELTLTRGQRVHLVARSTDFEPTLVVALDDTVRAYQFQARDEGTVARGAHVDVVAPVDGRY